MFILKRFAVLMLLALLPSVVCAQKNSSSAAVVEPTKQNLADWRAYILPAEKDLVWRNVDWLTTFGEGVIAANKADKPLLLWVMNGHPLGCT